MSFRIKDVHVVVAIDADDEEGVPAFLSGVTWMPLIAADPDRLRDIKEMAQEIADQTGRTLKLVRFSVREDVGEIRSKRTN